MDEHESNSDFPAGAPLRLQKFAPLPPIRPPTAGPSGSPLARRSVARGGEPGGAPAAAAAEGDATGHATARTRPLYRAPSTEPGLHSTLSSARSHASLHISAQQPESHPTGGSAPPSAGSAEARFTMPMPPAQPRPARGRPREHCGGDTGAAAAAAAAAAAEHSESSMEGHSTNLAPTAGEPTTVSHTPLSSTTTLPQTAKEPVVVDGEGSGPEVRIAVRLSNGARVQCICRSTTTLATLAARLTAAGEASARFSLATSDIPRRVIAVSEQTLCDAGLSLPCLLHVLPL